MSEAPQIEERVSLQLGDIIEIEAPTDETIDKQIFFLEYIDSNELHLVNAKQKTIFKIDSSGAITNYLVTSFNILSRRKQLGYAEQNNLVPGTLISIYFRDGDDLTITGRVKNLEEDQIEIETNKNDIFYIDFAYKGIPLDLPIKKIEIRNETQQSNAVMQTSSPAVSTEASPAVPTEESNIQQVDILFTSEQINFGEELNAVWQVVDLPESEQRFGIEKQTNDMLDILLSKIPNSKRTTETLNNIHKTIQRYKELRNEFSTFDQQNNANMSKRQGANYKPLVKTLETLNKKLYWILPVATLKKKIYDVNNEVAENFQDIEELTLGNVRKDEYEILEKYKNNDFGSDNKYHGLVRNINTWSTPYVESEENNNVIHTQYVPTPITAVLDNTTETDIYDGDSVFITSVANANNVSNKENSDIKRRLFFMQEYTQSLDFLETSKSETFVRKVGKDDKIDIKSFITLPKVAVQFSHINLPNTNIMIKSHLNASFLQYWRVLNDKTVIKDINIENSGEEDSAFPIQHDENDYLKNVTHYIPQTDVTEKDNDDTDKQESDTYVKYLNNIVPKTRVLFNLIKDDINGPMSTYQIIKFLEPFMIYHNDISFMQYQEFIKFINEKIREYKENLVMTKDKLSVLNVHSSRSESKLPLILNNNEKLYDEVIKGYGLMKLIERNGLTDDEIYIRIMSIDEGELLSAATAMTATSLITTNKEEKEEEIDDIVAKFNTTRKNNQQTQTIECQKYVLSKKYTSLQQLQADNDKDILFDKRYDNTYYDLMKEYEKELVDLSEEEQIEKLSLRLQDVNGLDINVARRDAKAIIKKSKVIEDGDYAVLEEESTFKYYKRQNNKWVLDTNFDETLLADETKYFCNNNNINCIERKNKCETLDTAIEQVNKITLQQIVSEYDQELEDDRETIIQKIKDTYDVALQNILALQKMNTYKNASVSPIANDIETVEASPHEGLRDAILGQADFAKRQENTFKFINHFTRPPNENEDKWWLYCINTGIKLLPVFFERICNAYLMKGNMSYMDTIDDICNKQGALGDDESVWVDKYSGYVIVKRAFDAQEGYTEEGFKITTREILEAPLDENVITSFEDDANKEAVKEEAEYNDPKSNTVFRIVSAMSKFAGINIDRDIDFIVKSVSKLSHDQFVIFGPKNYEKMRSRAIEKGKTLPAYEVYINKQLIFLTLAYILIAVQTSIPDIKIGRQHPGCIKSFGGYPISENGETGIIYLACIADKIKSSIKPWNSLEKTSARAIAKGVKEAISKHIISSSEIQHRIQSKLVYVQTHGNDDSIQPVSHAIRFTNFLPLLQISKGKVVSNLTPEFMNEMRQSFGKQTPQQDQYINVMRAKIIFLSVKIQELIEDAVQKNIVKEKAILTNTYEDPYLENACCWDSEKKPYEYFISINALLKELNKEISRISDEINISARMSSPRILFVPTDTKLKYPEISRGYSEDTIYRAFIKFCNYDSEIILNDDLQSVCGSNSDFDKDDTIENKITKLKQNNNYTQDNLVELLNTSSVSKVIPMQLSNDNNTEKYEINRLLNAIDNNGEYVDYDDAEEDENTYLIKDELSKLFEEYTEDIENLTRVLKDSVHEFMRSKLKTKKFNNYKEVIKSIEKFLDDEEETTFDNITYSNNCLWHICCVFPNMISNSINYSGQVIPIHWNLSNIHVNDITSKIANKYKKLFDLYDKNVELSGNARESLKKLYMISNVAIETAMKEGGTLERVGIIFRYCFHKALSIYISIVNDNIHELVIILCMIIEKQKKQLTINYTQLTEKINRSKHREKMDKLDRLGQMDDEAREIDNLKKYSKLGDEWGKGLQKNLRLYDKETYDKERLEGDATNNIDEMNGNEEDNQILMPDDDDYGDGDGDEMY